MTFLRDAVAGGFHHEEEALAFGGQPRTVKMRGAANIVDEAVFVSRLRSRAGRAYYQKRVACLGVIGELVPPIEKWDHHALYAFNPDDFHSLERPCYNCVTWGIGIANQLVPGFLVPVRQGRVKEVIKQLELTVNPAEPPNG